MRTILLCAALLAVAAPAAAQEVGGFVTGGTGSIDYRVHRETMPQASGGVLVRFADDRLRVGGQADVFTSNGYVSGRGGPIVELAPFRLAFLQPFVSAGRLWGDDTSWMVGVGVDFQVTRGAGIRLSVQDAFRPSSTSPFDEDAYTFHEPVVQIGWVWR